MPLAQVCSRFIDFFAAAALCAVLMVYYGVALGRWALMAPVFFVLLILFTVGFTLATSAINVFYRDVNPVVQIGAAAVAVSDAGGVSALGGVRAVPAALRPQPADAPSSKASGRRWCSTAPPDWTLVADLRGA